MSYSTLTSFNRCALAQLVNNGLSLCEMSEKLGFSRSTIHYELSRLKPYNPKLAQKDADDKRKKRKEENRGTFKVSQIIGNRPEYINNRSEFGHWEVDTVLSSRGHDKTCLATFKSTVKSITVDLKVTKVYKVNTA